MKCIERVKGKEAKGKKIVTERQSDKETKR